MQATGATQETLQKSAIAYKHNQTHTDAHTDSPPCYLRLWCVWAYTLMLTQCFPATLHMVTLSTEWVKTRRGTALAGSCSLTEQETQPFAVTIVLVSDNWGGGGVTVSTKAGQKMFVCVAGVSASRSWCMSFGLDRHVAITRINKENVSWYSGSKGSILWEMFIIWLQIRIRTR